MISDIDEYGFVKSEQENLYKQKYYEILSKRALRWNQVFGTSQIERGRTLRRFIRKGKIYYRFKPERQTNVFS